GWKSSTESDDSDSPLRRESPRWVPRAVRVTARLRPLRFHCRQTEALFLHQLRYFLGLSGCFGIQCYAQAGAPKVKLIRRIDFWHLLVALLSVTAITVAYVKWLGVTNHTTVAVSYLLVVLFVAATSPLWVAITTSFAAMLALNFFFLPPIGALTIADAQNWIALFAFLAVSLVASRLSTTARDRQRE